MKKQLIITALAAIFFVPRCVWGQWEPVSQSFPGVSYTVWAIAANDSVTIAITSGIFRSTDGGLGWAETGKELPHYSHYFSLQSLDSSEFFACHSSGLYRTKDNGLTWDTIAEFGVISVAKSGDIIVTSSYAGTYRSTDGGQTWLPVIIGQPNEYIRYLAFGDGVFFAQADYRVYASSDAGISWDTLFSKDNGTGHFTGLAVKDSIVVVPTSSGEIRISDNLGLTWKVAGTPSDWMFYGNPVVLNGQIYCSVWAKGLARSLDKGETWTLFNAGLGERKIYATAITDEQWFVGTDRGIFWWNDSTAVWEEKNVGLPSRVPYILFVSDERLFGFIDYEALLNIPKNSTEWSFCQVDSVFFHNFIQTGSTLVALTEYGEIHRSLDSGQTWHNVLSSLSGKFYPELIAAPDASIITATQEMGVIYSHDTGDTWEPRDNNGLPNFNFFDLIAGGNSLFVFFEDSILFRSDDLGNNWQVAGKLPTNNLYLMAASDDKHIYIIDYDLNFFTSQDGGQSWALIQVDFPYSMIARDSIVVLGGSPNSMVLVSTNYGLNWTSFDSGLPASYISALAADDAFLYASLHANSVDDNVWKRPWSQLLPTREAPILRPHNIQIIPNPAQESADIRLEPPLADSWQIQIFDALGKLVLAKTATGAKVRIERNDLPAGIYFFRATAKNGAAAYGKIVFSE